MLVVLDTNVLISALLWIGKSFPVIGLIDKGKITPCFSQETLDEFAEVLKRPKFAPRLKKAGLATPLILNTLKSEGELFELPKVKTTFIKEDPSDDKFLILSYVANAKYLVSGDNHLLKLDKFKNTQIISVSKFLELTDKL